MPEMTTISKAELTALKERVKRLAADKSYLQLIIQLMNKLGAVSGLENVIDSMLKTINDVIGGMNTILYYTIDHNMFYADVYGNRRQLDFIDDDLVKRSIETHESIEQEKEFGETKMLTPEFTKAYTWIVPLVVGSELIGVLKMENLHISMRDLSRQLPTFFSFAALVLKNEILGHTRLKLAYDELAQEMTVRMQVEEELHAANETLEEKVLDRTAELQKVNEQLRENEKQIRFLLDRSEQSRRTLLSILEDEKQAESALKNQYSTLRSIIDSIDALIFSVDRQYRYTSFNDKHAAVMKAIYGAEIEIGRSILGYMTVAEDRETAKSNLDRALVGEQLVEEAYSGAEPKSRRFFRVSHSPVRSEEGDTVGVVVLAQDMTERKQAESILQESEKRFKELLQEINLVAVILDTHGNIEFANDFFLYLTDRSRASVLNRNLIDTFVPEDQKDEFKQIFTNLLIEGKAPRQYEFDIMTLEGERHAISFSSVIVHDMAGNITGVASIGDDITEHRRAAEEIKESRRQVLDILESITDGFYALDNDWRFTYVNRRAEELFGVKRENLLFRNLWQIIAHEEAPGIYERFRSAKQEMIPVTFEEFVPRFNKWLEMHTYPYKNGISVYFRDITARKQTEERLTLLNFALDHVHEAAYLIDENARLLYVNDEVSRALGYSREELLGGMSMLDISPGWTKKRWNGHWQELKTRGSLVFEAFHMAKDGHTFPVEIYANMFYYKGADYNVALVRDITERKRAQEALRESEELYRSFVAASPDGVGVIDENGVVIFASRKINELLLLDNETDLRGASAFEWIAPEDRDKAKADLARIANGEVASSEEYRITGKGGARTYVEINGAPISDVDNKLRGIVTIVRDITFRKKAEQERETMHEKIEDERSFLEAVIKQMPLGVIIAEAPSGNVVAGNKSFERIWRLSFREANLIAAHDAYKVFHIDNEKPYLLENRPLYRSAVKGEAVKNERMRFMRGDGTFGILNESSTPIYDKSGKLIAAVVIFEEVS